MINKMKKLKIGQASAFTPIKTEIKYLIMKKIIQVDLIQKKILLKIMVLVIITKIIIVE